MGGNAFPRLNMVRVKREEVLPTVKFVVNQLLFPQFTVPYALDNLMGSAGKQDSSGDLDFAVNNQPRRFVGEPDLPVFDLRALAARAREVLPEDHVVTKGLRGGQFQTAFAVAGDPSRGFVQVDFIAGRPEWLKFSHHSPGLDVSPFKGVMSSTLLGVLAKMRVDYRVVEDDVETARVGLRFDLEKGLYRQWKLRKVKGQGMSVVTADEFETAQLSPRFTRLSHVTCPSEVLLTLFGRPVEFGEVDTFEKLVAKVHEVMPDRVEEVRSRFLEAFARSAGVNDYRLEDVANLDLWRA